MRELVFEILLRLSKALAAAMLGPRRLGRVRGPARCRAVGDDRPALLAERRGVHPPRRGEPDLSRPLSGGPRARSAPAGPGHLDPAV